MESINTELLRVLYGIQIKGDKDLSAYILNFLVKKKNDNENSIKDILNSWIKHINKIKKEMKTRIKELEKNKDKKEKEKEEINILQDERKRLKRKKRQYKQWINDSKKIKIIKESINHENKLIKDFITKYQLVTASLRGLKDMLSDKDLNNKYSNKSPSSLMENVFKNVNATLLDDELVKGGKKKRRRKKTQRIKFNRNKIRTLKKRKQLKKAKKIKKKKKAKKITMKFKWGKKNRRRTLKKKN